MRPFPRAAAATLMSAAAFFGLTVPAASPALAVVITPPAPGPFFSVPILFGATLSHKVGSSSQALSQPDDLVTLGGNIFVGFQNGVGSMGETSTTGNTASTLVELTPQGFWLAQWDLTGKIDGLGVANNAIVATVNEDGNSSLYTVTPTLPAALQVVHYTYSPAMLAHGGGTDAVTFFNGVILISASAPTVSNGPAVYSAALSGTTATLTPFFFDNSTATDAVTAAVGPLALTDPDSNTVVPSVSPRFAGQFMLDSQGDQQLIFAQSLAVPNLTVLNISQSVDDTAFPDNPLSTLYVTDATNNTVNEVFGPFTVGSAVTAVTPCNANSAPMTCPATGFPDNYLGVINLSTGVVAAANVMSAYGLTLHPKGMLFLDPGF